ncbi:MAG: glycine oxidase ThiO [Cyanobacteria bacterium P01_E01_bin.6]
MSQGSDILIIGGGIVGVSIALELQQRGAKVTVLTRDRKRAATQAAAGMLAPHAEQLPAGSLRELGLKSLWLYPEWIQRIEHLSGCKTGYWPSGILAPVYSPDPALSEHALLNDSSSHSSDALPLSTASAQWLNHDAIHQAQPGLGQEVVGGWWYPDDGQVDNRALFIALWTAAQNAGVTLKEAIAVDAIQHYQGRVTGVWTSDGLRNAEHYIVAAGAWSSDLLPVPVTPLKGQMIAVQSPFPQGGSLSGQFSELKRVLFGDDCYLVPRHDGRILIGATVESVGFTPHNTLSGLQSLLSAALRLYPRLSHYPMVEQWWGYRPATPDEQPILGPTHCDNLTIAAGHHRNGILLAPATALLIADWVLNQTSTDLLAAFSWQRFGCESWVSAHSPVLPTSIEANGDEAPSAFHREAISDASSSPTLTDPLLSLSYPMPTLHSSSSALAPQQGTEFNSSSSTPDSSLRYEEQEAPLTIAGRTFRSRLMTGTGKYRDFDQMRQAIAASGCQIVTVAVRRVQTQAPGHEGLAEALDWTKLWMLPNTAGCKTAEEAIRVARLGREMAKLLGQEDNNFVKLEVIPDTTYLLPDPIGTLEAAEQLVKEGFAVLPYINADPLLAKRLEEAGCATVMPLGSPIGSGQGIRNAANIQIIIENATVPVVVDAGIGTPSEAAQAMEMGADALLINTAIAQASHPGQMGRAMKLAAEAGRLACLAGRIPIRQSASASSPLTGTISS